MSHTHSSVSPYVFPIPKIGRHHPTRSDTKGRTSYFVRGTRVANCKVKGSDDDDVAVGTNYWVLHSPEVLG